MHMSIFSNEVLASFSGKCRHMPLADDQFIPCLLSPHLILVFFIFCFNYSHYDPWFALTNIMACRCETKGMLKFTCLLKASCPVEFREFNGRGFACIYSNKSSLYDYGNIIYTFSFMHPLSSCSI